MVKALTLNEIAVLPQKIIDRKTIVLKSRFNSTTAKLMCEKMKDIMFASLGFSKPEEMRLISVGKFYEPYLIVGGKYSIDHCRKQVFTIKVDGETLDIVIFDKKLKPKTLSDTFKKIEIESEAHFHYEDETYCILDKTGREVTSEQIPYAPFEAQAIEKLAEVNTKLGEIEISPDEEINFLRSRIVKRPLHVGEVTREIFEVSDRSIVYVPIYQLTFQNTKTGNGAIMKIDGISGEIVIEKDLPEDKNYGEVDQNVDEERITLPF